MIRIPPCLTRVRARAPLRIAVLQVIYQYASIVTGVNVHYPEPARTIIRVVSVFSLQFLNYAPPECVNEGASFYDRLLIMTIFQILVAPTLGGDDAGDENARTCQEQV